MNKIFAFLVALLLPGMAQAAWTNCQGTTLATTGSVGHGKLICYEFTDGTDSGLFSVTADAALICHNPDITTEGPATSTIYIRACTAGGSASAFTCHKTTTTPITGLTGSSGTQDACQRVPRGAYYIDVQTPSGGETSQVTIRGEN